MHAMRTSIGKLSNVTVKAKLFHISTPWIYTYLKRVSTLVKYQFECPEKRRQKTEDTSLCCETIFVTASMIYKSLIWKWLTSSGINVCLPQLLPVFLNRFCLDKLLLFGFWPCSELKCKPPENLLYLFIKGKILKMRWMNYQYQVLLKVCLPICCFKSLFFFLLECPILVLAVPQLKCKTSENVLDLLCLKGEVLKMR